MRLPVLFFRLFFSYYVFKAFRVYVEAQHELETPMTLRGCERFDILSCLNNMSKRFR